jgi:Zn-finger nucleic acid-binding protein
MNCPHCPNTTLVMSDRQGIEIDYCPQCRGVWLDRGELDKLIERSAAPPAAATTRPHAQPDFVDSDHPGSYSRGRRKKNWLSDIFD